MKEPLLVDQAMLDALSLEARTGSRLRKNRNFHEHDADPAHRLLNAIEPGSYIPPHRHLDPTKDETMIVLRGRLGIVFFDAAGRIGQTVLLTVGGPVCAITIPHGVYHSVLACESGTVFFEAKAGPYLPLTDEERASWAPLEGDQAAVAYLKTMADLFAPETP